MADDNVIRVGTSVDTAALKAGLTTATDAVSRAVVDLKAQYDQLTARGKELREVLSSRINPAALESVRQEAAALTQQQAILRAQLTAANQALREQAAISAGLAPSLAQVAAAEAAQADEARVAALESAKLAEARLATAAATEAEAVAARAAAEAEAALAVNTTQARFAAQLLSREVGVALPRALSSVAAQSTALGPILEAAFPYGVAAFLGIELGKILVAGYDLYDNWINLKEASLALDVTTRKTFESIQADLEGANRATEEYLRLTAQVARIKAQESASAGDSSGAAAASEQARAGLAAADKFRMSVEGQRQIDPSKLLDVKKLGKLSDDIQKSIAKAFAPGTIAEAGDRVTEVMSRLTEIKGLLADFNPVGGKTKKDLEVEQGFLEDAVVKWKAVADRYIKDSKTAQARFEHDQAEAVKQGTQEQLAAQRARAEQMRQAEAGVRKSNQAAMTALEAKAVDDGTTGRALSLQKIQKIDEEIAAEQKYTDVVAGLQEQRVRLSAEAVQQGKAQYDKGLQVAKESLDKLVAQTKAANAEQARYFEQMLKRQAGGQKGQLETATGSIQADSEATVGGLQSQKLQVQRSYELGGDDSVSAKVRELAQLRAIDDQIIAEEIRKNTVLAGLYSGIDNTKSAGFATEAVKAQQKANQQQYAETTQILLLQQHAYDTYFKTIGSGFQNAVDGWIRTGQGFQLSMQNIGASLVTDMANHWIQLGLKWAQQELTMTLTHIAGNEARTVSDANAAAQGAVISQTSQISQQLAAAKVAASNTYASVSAVPLLGPVLAPPAAAAAFAAVLAFDTGGIVPATGLALVHQNEGVLTPPQTQWLQSAAQNGANGGSGGSVTVNSTQNYNGLTDATFKALADKHSSYLLNTIQRGARKRNMV